MKRTLISIIFLFFLIAEGFGLSGCAVKKNESSCSFYASDSPDCFCPKDTNSSIYDSCFSPPYQESIEEQQSINPTIDPYLRNIEISYWRYIPPYFQDGCIFDNTLFLFDSEGFCNIFDIPNNELVCVSRLPSFNGILPHSNSACFGQKYVDSDRYPLFYTNVYNNYPNNEETYGMCLVYRIIEENDFIFDLVQAIKISFSNDYDIWFNNSDNIRPFGNFLIENSYLWVYLNIFGSNITRFFKFDLPQVYRTDNKILISLDVNDILETFDLPLFSFIQGGIIYNHFLYSLEGLGSEAYPAILRSVDLKSKEFRSIDLSPIIGYLEPEFIDFYCELLLIGTRQGYCYYLV